MAENMCPEKNDIAILTRQKHSQHNAYEYIHASEEQWTNTLLRRTGYTLFVADSPGTTTKKIDGK